MTSYKSKNQKQQDQGIKAEKTNCPKCGSRNVLIIGEKGERTLSCLDCDYAEGVGTN